MAAGFPSGQYRLESKILEVKLAVEDGANEIDIVISRDAALEQDWKRLYHFHQKSYILLTKCRSIQIQFQI